MRSRRTWCRPRRSTSAASAPASRRPARSARLTCAAGASWSSAPATARSSRCASRKSAPPARAEARTAPGRVAWGPERVAVEQRPVVEERHGLGVLVDHHAWSPPLAIAQNLQSSMPRLHRAAPSPIRRRYLTDASPNARDMSSQSNQTPEASQEQDSQERFTRVSLVAIFAGALASISAAVVASFLGVAGTLIGAALVSVVSSLAGAIYSGLLSSTHNLVRRSV